jgi:ubiquinone/menaquinone biosynthesis C-methylase UbiE
MTENECCCTIETCDIFDFMAHYVGLSVLHPGGFKATEALANECQLNKNSKIIDIACGKGTTSLFLAQKFGCTVVGIDISADLINEARALARNKSVEKNVTFQVADALDLPFADNTFDFAISQAMLVLIKDQKRAIEEAILVIKPGGYAGWIELSWKKHPTEQFLDEVANVIYAYCMLNVHTYGDWERIFKAAGATELTVIQHSTDFSEMQGMVADEGFWNSLKIMSKYVFNKGVRKRLNTLNTFFNAHPDYFEYGIYIVRK